MGFGTRKNFIIVYFILDKDGQTQLYKIRAMDAQIVVAMNNLIL